MSGTQGVIVMPLEPFDGTVAQFRELLAGLHDERSDSGFPERWPYPHDTRRGDIHVMSGDRLWLGPVKFVEQGIAFRHVMIELEGGQSERERYHCLAVYGRRKERNYNRPDGRSYTRVDPFVVCGWRDAGRAVQRLFSHGVGLLDQETSDAKGFDIVVLTEIDDGTYDWTSIEEPPHDLDECPDF